MSTEKQLVIKLQLWCFRENYYSFCHTIVLLLYCCTIVPSVYVLFIGHYCSMIHFLHWLSPILSANTYIDRLAILSQSEFFVVANSLGSMGYCCLIILSIHCYFAGSSCLVLCPPTFCPVIVDVDSSSSVKVFFTSSHPN